MFVVSRHGSIFEKSIEARQAWGVPGLQVQPLRSVSLADELGINVRRTTPAWNYLDETCWR